MTTTATPTASPASGSVLNLKDYDQIEEDENRLAEASGTKKPKLPFKIRLVEKGFGTWLAITAAMAWLAFVGFGVFGLLFYIYETTTLTAVMSSLIALAFAVFFTYEMFYADVDSLTKDVYENWFTGNMVVFSPGFFIIPPWLVLKQTINYQKEEIRISARSENNTAHKITSSDPYDLDMEWETIGTPMDTAEGIGHYIQLTPEIRESRVRAVMNSRLSTCGGKYPYLMLLENFGELSQWVGRIFGGKRVTDFEMSIGMHIDIPRLINLSCKDPAAERNILNLSLTKQAIAIMKENPELSKEDVMAMVERIAVTTENINVKGAPGAKTVMAGGTPVVAVGR